MKTLKIISWALLVCVAGLVTTSAQPKGSPNTRWRMVSGPYSGITLLGTGGAISDPFWEASGTVGSGPECDCSFHFHGTIRGKEDPNPDSCGWGCVEQQPFDASAAEAALQAAIASATATNTALGNKLNSIRGTAQTALANDCSTLFESAINAFADELLGASSNGQITDEDANEIILAVLDYVALGLDQIAEFPEPPPAVDCKVALMLRHGSGPQTKLFTAKRKVNADVGEVTVLDAQGVPPGGTYEWDYKFKGQAAGDVPSGAGISFTSQRFCALSQRPTTVTVTVTYHCPDGKKVKDTATINIQ